MELATPGSEVRLASVARHITDCAMRPGEICLFNVLRDIPGTVQNKRREVSNF